MIFVHQSLHLGIADSAPLRSARSVSAVRALVG
jgi:hypothetical protein